MKLVKLATPQFADALKTLMKMPGVPPKTMFIIRGIGKVISEEMTKYNDIRSAIVDEFALRDGKGEIVRISADTIKVDPTKTKDMDKKLKELYDLGVNLPEVKYSDLGEKANLTSDDIYQLEFIVE